MNRLILIPIILLIPHFAFGQGNVRITNPSASPGLVSDIAYNAAAVTPSNSVDLANPATRGLWVGGAGAVKVDTIGGQTVTYTAVAAGTWLKVGVRRVYSTGTDATLIIALY